jgi:hypothetical protein
MEKYPSKTYKRPGGPLPPVSVSGSFNRRLGVLVSSLISTKNWPMSSSLTGLSYALTDSSLYQS